MKKTLIALAVLAASGASFAQVTITGNLTMGYAATSSGSGADQSGLGVDTSEIDFAATEDLGGGLKATALMALAGADRSGEGTNTTQGAVQGRDASLTLSNPAWGAVAIKTVRPADYLSGGIANVGGVGLDNKVFSAKSNTDSVSYTSPSFSGFTVGLSAGEPADVVGLGAGAAGQPALDKQRSTGVSAAYAAGALAVNGSFTAYDQKGTETTTPANFDTKVLLSAAYDFGVFKLGAGVDSRKLVKGTRNDALVGVAVPIGSLSLNASLASRQYSDNGVTTGSAANAEGTRTGYGLQANYALSKRTSLIAQYRSWQNRIADEKRATESNFLVSHSF